MRYSQLPNGLFARFLFAHERRFALELELDK